MQIAGQQEAAQADAEEETLTALVERAQIDSLASAAGADAAKAVMNAFWSSCEDLLSSLEHAVEAADFAEAARNAHAVKGSAANVGATRMAERARLIEMGCRDSALDATTIGVKRLAADFRATRNAFEELLQTLS